MSHKFGLVSSNKLATVCPELVSVCARALEMSPYDFSIIHGWRGEDVQNALFDSAASTKQWPDSKHNVLLKRSGQLDRPNSEAIDFAPWVYNSIPWKETHIFALIAGTFFAAAAELDVVIRWGGDWDTDGLTSDQTLMDYGHIEIIK